MHEYRLVQALAVSALVGVAAGMLGGCSTASRQSASDKDDLDAMRTQLGELRTLMVSQGGRLESVETRMASLGDKVTTTQLSVENLLANRKALPTPVITHPSEGAGTEPQSELAQDDPEAGFQSDAAIQDFRKGQILLEARKYPEAMLAFTGFVEKYPDHVLAGSAQFNVGESYFKQKEYKLALPEFERVLTSYDRSAHVSDTLRDLAETEDALKMPEQAARHRQLLTSLFSQSPAASLSQETAPPASVREAPPAATHEKQPAETGLPTAPLTAPSATEGR